MNRKFAAFVAAATLSGLAAPIAATPASAAVPKVLFTAQAYGSQVNVGGVVKSGPTALSSLSCTTIAGKRASASIASADLPVGSLGAVTTNARTGESSTSKVSYSDAKVSGVNLFGGLIKAEALSTATSAAINSSAAFSAANVTKIVGLTIGGRTISATTPANTKVSLGAPGQTPFATVVVNKQERVLIGSEYRAATAAVTVIINGSNDFGLPIGARVDIAQSRAYLSKPIAGVVGGKGFATQARLLDGKITSSPTALLHARCIGGEGSTNLAGVTVPGLVSTGTTETTSKGSVSPTARSVAIRNTIASPKVLNGLISAQAITAETSVSQTDGGTPVITDTSKFLGLQVAGLPALGDNIEPNTSITIPTLGKVTFHKVTKSTNSIEVVMIEVVLNQPIADLPTGSIVQIGYSKSYLL